MQSLKLESDPYASQNGDVYAFGAISVKKMYK